MGTDGAQKQLFFLTMDEVKDEMKLMNEHVKRHEEERIGGIKLGKS